MSAAARAGLCVIVLLSVVPEAKAQEGGFSQRSPIPKFSLSVSKQDSILHPKQEFVQNKVLDSSSVPWVNSGTAAPTRKAPLIAQNPRTESGQPPAMMVPAPPAMDDRPNSYLEEYQVNWSPWISNLANRWHGILKDSETLIGVEFHTTRAALIQFTCYADGRIGNVFLRQSSGIPVYDRMQILSLMECGPLEPFPPGTQKSQITLIQGWESHRKRPGEQEFNTRAFAERYSQEKVSKWVSQ